MAETAQELIQALQTMTASGFRGRLLARGLARGMIWNDGELPPDPPPFSSELTDDLLDYGHALLATALRLYVLDRAAPIIEPSFRIAGEAIEAVVHRGDQRQSDVGFHRVTAAIAFHLAHHAARSYSILPDVERQNLSPAETALAWLLRRSLGKLRSALAQWLLAPEYDDDAIAAALSQVGLLDADEAVNRVLTGSFLRAMAWFESSLVSGNPAAAGEAQALLLEGAATASDLGFVPQWWLHRLAAHLLGDLWEQSLHTRLPILPPDSPGAERWNELRRDYIALLQMRDIAQVELWPSQLEAAQRALEPLDDLVVSLPTGAGKTRIAELAILRALSLGQRAIYVTPLRALSAQVERELASIFVPLGFKVSALYGAAGSADGDFSTLGNRDLVIATPEKLDFAIRNEPEIIDDVGLIVLDEGHMIGPDEREVRYEILVQRLLRRPDASSRRLVCLSALFPEGEALERFVAWLRQDEPGAPIRSTWRPTRQRFGVVTWRGEYARLDLSVDGEEPYVENYIDSTPAPRGSGRRKRFPHDKDELTIATAWKFAGDGKGVLVYCAIRASVEKLGRAILDLCERKILKSLIADSTRLAYAVQLGTEWLGADHPAVRCLSLGVVLHHAGLPRPFLAEVEKLLHTRPPICQIVIASPTLAQGLNLAASTLIVHQIWRNQATIPPVEFANIAGRAGRAHIDLDGVIIHTIFEKEQRKAEWSARQWWKLVHGMTARNLQSGILTLLLQIVDRLRQHLGGGTLDDLLAYITGNTEAWSYHDFSSEDKKDPVTPAEWQRWLASLDSAVLGLVEDLEADPASLAALLDEALRGSLFVRDLESVDPEFQSATRFVLESRAELIWAASSADQRKGYYLAGLGLASGQTIDQNAPHLIALLAAADEAVGTFDFDLAAEAIVEIAKVVLAAAPFVPYEIANDWEQVVQGWLQGMPLADLFSIGGDNTSDFIQDGVVYRLTWALEAIRVQAVSSGAAEAEQLSGRAALATETGTTNLSAALLLRAGLSSRQAALLAVQRTGAQFTDSEDMQNWLSSEEIKALSERTDWPSPETSAAWRRFIFSEADERPRPWTRRTVSLTVAWREPPEPGAFVRILPGPGLAGLTITTADYKPLGRAGGLAVPRNNATIATVVDGKVQVELFGPPSGR